MKEVFPSLSTFGLDHSYGSEETKNSCSVSHVTAQDCVFLTGQGEGMVWNRSHV